VTHTAIRSNWTIEAIREVYDRPLLELVRQAADVHREHFDPAEVQVCQLVSIKTGGCPEDCGYCSQSVHNDSSVKPEPLMGRDEVVRIAKRAKRNGVTRLCLGAAWREVKDNNQFERVLDIVRGVNDEGLEVCATLGMLDADQAAKLEAAGLYAYNHNLDTSAEYYETIITTRTFQDRLDTIDAVRTTDVTVCSGGIIGMGESDEDIIDLALTLRAMEIDSIPVNFLNSIPQTPFETKRELTPQRCLKTLCLFRFVNPNKEIRVAGGREVNLRSLQPLSLYPANSMFVNGYLTTTGQDATDAHQMIRDLGFELDQPAAI